MCECEMVRQERIGLYQADGTAERQRQREQLTGEVGVELAHAHGPKL